MNYYEYCNVLFVIGIACLLAYLIYRIWERR